MVRRQDAGMKIIGALVALITGQGWQWARVLEENGTLRAGWGVPVAMCLAGAFVLNQILLAMSMPVPRSVVRERAAAVNLLLEGLLSEYYRNLEASRVNDAPPPIVRCNVMLPVRRWFGQSRHLQIAYRANLPDASGYEPDELDVRWRKREGVVGWVWHTGHESTFSRARMRDSSTPRRNLTAQQSIAVSALKSVYSVPILKSGVVVGILNLNAQDDLNRSLFDLKENRDLMRKYAQVLASQCFAQGMLAR